jgi:hypothetical protein
MLKRDWKIKAGWVLTPALVYSGNLGAEKITEQQKKIRLRGEVWLMDNVWFLGLRFI